MYICVQVLLGVMSFTLTLIALKENMKGEGRQIEKVIRETGAGED